MFKYSTVRGVFQQDDPLTDARSFDYTNNFGLIEQVIGADAHHNHDQKAQWRLFAANVAKLNAEAPKHTRYAVLYMGRHGEGWHNVAEALYGTPAWDSHWSMLDGHDGMRWADAHLTDKGKQQALIANAFWKKLAPLGLPSPQSFYSSPLDRCLETAFLTFGNLELPSNAPFRPQIKELLREVLGVHTCDRRSTKTHISSRHSTFTFEPGFSETDQLWHPDHRETNEEQETRLRSLLDDLFAKDKNTFISLTAHSGAIRALLSVLGHREFALPTGAVIPVLVKVVESDDGSR